MIKSKQEYKFYLKADSISRSRRKRTLLERMMTLFPNNDKIWEYQKTLRKVENKKNCRHGLIGRIRFVFLLRKLHITGRRLGFYIHPNNFGPGLSISHPGIIIVNADARIGANCRIHPGTVIAT